jgi:glutamine synthetase
MEIDRVEVVARRAREADVRLVRFLYCDNGGIIRGKAVHVDRLEERMRGGIGLTVAMMAMNALDQLQPVEGMGPVGEVRLLPDPETFTVLPYAPHTAVMLADQVQLDGTPWGACPRSFLKRVLERARTEAGLQVQAAFEPEWSLAVRLDDGSYRPVDQSLCFSSVGMMTAAALIDEVCAMLEQQGLRVEQYYPELGHGQQELSIRHADALRAADNHLLYKETVRNVAHRHGLVASFAPKPWPDRAGNGCHLHFSAWDARGERNLFADPASAPYGLSELGAHFLAGVLEHLPALVALTCPSVNSYRRLRPQSWSSAFTCYGRDNREAAVRIVSTLRGAEATSANLELKPSDSSANPYLALAGLVLAGLDGVARKLRPAEGQLVDLDPARLSEDERAARGIRRLPASLDEALDAFERDTVLAAAFPELLRRSFLAVRRSEARFFAEVDADSECRLHFAKY